MVGKITEFKKNQEDITFVKNEPLEEGEYSITIEDGNEKLTRKFKIDNTAPIIYGLEKSIHSQAVSIIFENIEDVTLAVLKLPNENGTINLDELYGENQLEKNSEGKSIYQLEYNQENKGEYTLRVKDAANNIYVKKFAII